MVLKTDILQFSINMCRVLLRVTVQDRLSSSLTSPWFSSPVDIGHWTLDSQYGFLGSERETGDLDLDNGSKKELHKHVAVLQTGCINNQTIQMMITMRNPTLNLTLEPCLSPFKMQN